MSSTALMENVVDLIDGNAHEQAVQAWAQGRHESSRCVPCFYSPLPRDVRCAACLDSHLNHATLKRGYPKIGQERISSAKASLKTWLGSLDRD